MAGPLIEKVKEELGIEGSVAEVAQEAIDNVDEKNVGQGAIIRERKRELKESMDSGGCCNAFQAAEATRNGGKEYR